MTEEETERMSKEEKIARREQARKEAKERIPEVAAFAAKMGDPETTSHLLQLRGDNMSEIDAAKLMLEAYKGKKDLRLQVNEIFDVIIGSQPQRTKIVEECQQAIRHYQNRLDSLIEKNPTT